MSRQVIVIAECPALQQNITIGPHQLRADEPITFGGTDAGPDPYELLLAALGACTGITVRMYSERKNWPLAGVQVQLAHSKIHAEDCADCETRPRTLDRIDLTISFTGTLSTDQLQKLGEIANRCPVHRTLSPHVQIHTSLV
jgi:putative redox protein